MRSEAIVVASHPDVKYLESGFSILKTYGDRVELRHLRYFIAVAEEEHFTRAAERLQIQQPPLSQQIRALEEELGFPLFRRHPRGAALTTGGVAFLAEARAILNSVQDGAARAARAASGAEGHLSVGFTSSAAAHAMIPHIMRAYRAAWPGVRLDCREGNAAELTEALADGTLHAAFLRQPVSRPEGIVFHTLLEEEMLLVLPTGHAALARHQGRGVPRVALGVLRDEQFVLVRRTGAPGMYADLVAACERAGFTPKIAVEVDRMLTNISLVAAGAGVSAVPASMRGFHEGSVVYCKIADGGVAAPLTLACRAADPPPTLANFLAEAERLAQRPLTT